MAEPITSRIVRSVEGGPRCATCAGLIVAGATVTTVDSTVWHDECYARARTQHGERVALYALDRITREIQGSVVPEWACPCCGAETDACGTLPQRTCSAGCRYTQTLGEPWLTSVWWPTPPRHMRARDVCSVHGFFASTSQTAAAMPPKATAPVVPCGYCGELHPHDRCARVVSRAIRTGERVSLDQERPWRPGTWRPVSGIAIADALRGRPDHRGSQRPCDVCGLGACSHPREKAGWSAGITSSMHVIEE